MSESTLVTRLREYAKWRSVTDDDDGARLTALLTEAADLIARLPVTRDDVRVGPGDKVYAYYENNLPGHRVVEYTVPDMHLHGDSIRWCYSSRTLAEAQESASAAGKGGQG